MTDRELKTWAYAGLALWAVCVANGAHSLAMQHGGIWRAFCPVMEGVR